MNALCAALALLFAYVVLSAGGAITYTYEPAAPVVTVGEAHAATQGCPAHPN